VPKIAHAPSVVANAPRVAGDEESQPFRDPELADLCLAWPSRPNAASREYSAICLRMTASGSANCSHSVAALFIGTHGRLRPEQIEPSAPAMPGSGLPARSASLSELGIRAEMTQPEPGILRQARPPGINSPTNTATRCCGRLRMA
jgi:hypothetical protein